MTENNVNHNEPTPEEKLQNIIEAEHRLAQCRKTMKNLKEDMKQAKANLATAEKELSELIGECEKGIGGGDDKNQQKLFADQESDGTADGDWGDDDNVDEDFDLETGEIAGPGSHDDDYWKGTPLAFFEIYGMKKTVIKALAEHTPEILTLGDLTDWQAKKGDFWLKDIKGLGPSAQQNIDEATAKYWESRQGRGKVASSE